MKRYIASMLFAAVIANEAEKSGDDAEGDGDDTSQAISDWFSSEQTPVEWESIASGGTDDCKLKGAYGGYKKVGLSQVFIREEVHDCEITNAATVLTWAAIENPDVAGEQEGFYCYTRYQAPDGKKSAGFADVDVETQQGKLDYAAWSAVQRKDWCKEVEGEEGTCKRQGSSQWKVLPGDGETNYPQTWDADTKKSSLACSAYRFAKSIDHYMEIKFGVEYTVKTGFMIYENGADFDNGIASRSKAGTAVMMTFEAAAALAVGASIISALAF